MFEVKTGGSLRRVFAAQLMLCAGLFVVGTAWFAFSAQGISARFAQLAIEQYVGFVVGVHVRVMLAYVAVAALAALMVAPFASRVWSIAAANVAWFVLSLGPLSHLSPGVLDVASRALPHFDLQRLVRWHVFDVLLMMWLLAVCWVGVCWLRWLPRRGRVAAGLAGVVAVSSVAWPPTPQSSDEGPLNVLVLASDSWRFDHVGVHGSRWEGLTPNIDALARDATDVTGMHVATASTLESWASMLTGLSPPRHGLRSMYPSREAVERVEQLDSVPRVFSSHGYQTFVSSDWAGNCFDLVDFGFGTRRVGGVQNFRALLLEASVKSHPLMTVLVGAWPAPVANLLIPGRAQLASTVRPEILVDQLFTDIDRALETKHPFFGVLFVSPTHLPYNSRATFASRYVTPGYDGPHRWHVEVSAHELITTGFEAAPPARVVEHIRQLYAGAVSDFDDTVGEVVRRLRARQLLERTVIVVTTDHGEDLYEPGSTLGHGTNFFGGDQSTHIPLFIRVPQAIRGAERTVRELAQNTDLAATLVELAGLQAPETMRDSRSLAGWVRRGVARSAPRDAVFSETCYLFFPKSRAMTMLGADERARLNELAGADDTLDVDAAFRDNLVVKPGLREACVAAKDRMVRTERWKLVDIASRGAPIRRLYDLDADPRQTRDVRLEHPEVEATLLQALDGWWSPPK